MTLRGMRPGPPRPDSLQNLLRRAARLLHNLRLHFVGGGAEDGAHSEDGLMYCRVHLLALLGLVTLIVPTSMCGCSKRTTPAGQIGVNAQATEDQTEVNAECGADPSGDRTVQGIEVTVTVTDANGNAVTGFEVDEGVPDRDTKSGKVGRKVKVNKFPAETSEVVKDPTGTTTTVVKNKRPLKVVIKIKVKFTSKAADGSTHTESSETQDEVEINK